MLTKLHKVTAWQTQDGSLFIDKEEALEYDINTAEKFNRGETYREKGGWINDYIFQFDDADFRDKPKSADDISHYSELSGWECEDKDNPIDRCVYSDDLWYREDACVFCGKPEERK